MHPLLHITSEITFQTYFVIIFFDVLLAFLLTYVKARRNNFQLKVALDLLLINFVFGFIGARLLHIVYENPTFYWTNPSEIFAFWNGGFVFDGGLIAAVLMSIFYLYKIQERYEYWFDFFTPIASLCYAIGRFACLFAGCCYGKTCDLPWAIRFLDEQNQFLLRHPTQLYLSLWELTTLLFVFLILKQKNNHSFKKISASGNLFLSWLFLHSLGRFFIEFLRDDFRGAIYGVSLSSWTSLCIMITAVYVFFKNSKRSKLL